MVVGVAEKLATGACAFDLYEIKSKNSVIKKNTREKENMYFLIPKMDNLMTLQ